MRIPEKLLFEGKEVAILKGFSYETPWFFAQPEFLDTSIPTKLDSLSKFRAYDRDLEDMELPEQEEETLWENKLSELGLTHSDLKLDKDGSWEVVFNDGNIDQIHSLTLYDGEYQGVSQLDFKFLTVYASHHGQITQNRYPSPTSAYHASRQ